MTIYKFTLLVSIFLMQKSWADESHFCQISGEIEAQIEYCFDNNLFVQSADKCLQGFEAEIVKYQKSLSTRLAQIGAATDNAQSEKFKNNQNDLLETSKALTNLIKTGEIAKADLFRYKEAMILPGAPSKSYVEENGLYELLSSAICFKNNQIAIDNQISSLEKKILELKTSNKAAAQVLKKNDSSLGNLKASQKDAGKSHPPISAYEPIPETGDNLNSPKHKSDISGETKPKAPAQKNKTTKQDE